MIREKRRCCACDEEIHGRKDKRFCSDYCRAVHHNQRHHRSTALMRSIQYVLRKNRQILMALNPRGKAKVPRTLLMEEGLHFGFHTHQWESGGGRLYLFCYEYGYADLGNGMVELLKKEIEPDQRYGLNQFRMGLTPHYQKASHP